MNIPRRPFLRLLALCSALLLPFGAGAQTAHVSLTVLGTTDLHGNIYPIDYYANKPANRGLAKIATLIREARQQQPNLLLVDSGDTIQGTPLAYYAVRKDSAKPNPTIAVMNAMRYDAMALGNHEFNFGLPALWKAKGEARFPFLAANIRQSYKGGVAEVAPYVVKEVAGVRVGIVGFITPRVPSWEVPENYRGYEFEPIVDAARRVIPELRKRADLVIALVHSGLERDLQSGQALASDTPGENAVWALAEQVPGIDVILMGHTHQELAEEIVNGVLLVQARNWGQSLARVDIEMQRDSGAAWRVASKHSSVLPVTDAVTPDPEILQLARPFHDATQAYLDTPIADSSRPLDGSTARYEDHPLVDLIHKVQLEAGKADVSMATMFYPRLQFPPGKITVRQLAGLYLYENTLYTVAMSGAQLRAALEHAASFYPAWPFKPEDNVRLPGYNADCAEGVNYEIDLTQPEGHRIRNLTYKGKPLSDDEKLRVAINNYRYAGGGRYRMYQGLPVFYRSPTEIRDLLIEYVTRTGVIPRDADGNWRIVPPEAFAALVREAQQRELGARGGP